VKKIKFRIIGIGNVGSLHAENLLKMKEIGLKVVSDKRIKEILYKEVNKNG
jgi:glutamate dehydrogenase/leucine dehydrogenase